MRVTASEALAAEQLQGYERIAQAKREYYKAIAPVVMQLGRLHNSQNVRYTVTSYGDIKSEVVWDVQCKAAYDECVQTIQEIHHRIFGIPHT